MRNNITLSYFRSFFAYALVGIVAAAITATMAPTTHATGSRAAPVTPAAGSPAEGTPKRKPEEKKRSEITDQRGLVESGWRLLWQEDFSEDEIDESHWGHEVNCTGGGNNEGQCYTARPENSFVKDGVLHVVAKEEIHSGPALPDDDVNYDPNDTSRTLAYTSARLRSKNKFDFTYGRVEVRAKVPGGKGMWPAIWMLPTDSVYGGWPSSGEIDIMEAVNLGVWANELHGTNHYGLKWPQWENHGQTLPMAVNPADDFHVYAIEWEADEIRWYVDGQHYQTQTSEGWYNYVWQGQEKGFQVSNPRAPYDQDFHLILNVAVGGNWPGAPDAGWAEDREMLVDYVRVYQCHNPMVKPHRGDEGYTGAGCATVDETVEVNTDTGAPGINAFPLYADGPSTFTFDINGSPVNNTLAPGYWESVEGTVFQSEINVGGDYGLVWDIKFNGTGNVFLRSGDMSAVPSLETGVQLEAGAGWHNSGQLEFDIFVAEVAPDSQLLVKLDSGWPNAGEKIIDIPAVGEWYHVAVSIGDLQANPGPEGGGVDLSNVQTLFVLEHHGEYASMQVDNIRLQCAFNTEPEHWQRDKTCGLSPRLASTTPLETLTP